MKKYDDRYINNEKKFLKFTFDAYKNYFNDYKDFINFYNTIQDNEMKNKFLKLGSFYKFLIIDGSFINQKDRQYNQYIDYFDYSYKYIAIFSFIEDLYSNEEHVDFYDWLNSKKNNIQFPIKNRIELKKYYNAYLEIHGTTKKAYKFFNSLDEQTKRILLKKVEVRKDTASFNEIVKILFQIRNDFVHRAKLVVHFNQGPNIHVSLKNKIIVNKLSFKDIQTIYERGFLKFFGYIGDYK